MSQRIYLCHQIYSNLRNNFKQQLPKSLVTLMSSVELLRGKDNIEYAMIDLILGICMGLLVAAYSTSVACLFCLLHGLLLCLFVMGLLMGHLEWKMNIECVM